MPPASIRRGRHRAESLMQDTCTIRRVTGETLDEDTLEIVPTYETIYAGKCKVQAQTTLQSSAQEIGGRVATVVTRRVDVPTSAPEVQVNDEVVIDTSLDGQLVGKTFRITTPFAKTFATARRLEVQEP